MGIIVKEKDLDALTPIKLRDDLITELRNDKTRTDIQLNVFFNHKDTVFSCGPKVEIKVGKHEKIVDKFRIDCAKSTDKKYMEAVRNNDCYYLQLQDNEENQEKHSRGSKGCTGSLTYANVLYPKSSSYNHAALFDAIITSLEKQKTVWLIP